MARGTGHARWARVASGVGAILAGLLAAMMPASADESADTVVYTSGQAGYHTFRIPALAVTTEGTVLAFAEGRRKSAGDAGQIDLVVRRSTDSGATWSEPRIVWSDGDHTCGNPCPVVDGDSGS